MKNFKFACSIIVSFVVLFSAYNWVSSSNHLAYANSDWEAVGAAGFSTGYAGSPMLAMHNGMPYVAFRDEDAGEGITVMKYNGTAWELVGTPGFTGDYAGSISLVVDNGVPYVAYVDEDNGGKAKVMKFNGAAWETVGPGGISSGYSNYTSLAFDNGTPYVAFLDNDNGEKATVMKFNGSVWETVGDPGFSEGIAEYTSLAFAGGTPYVAFVNVTEGEKAAVMKFNGSAWETVGPSVLSTGSINRISLEMSGSTPYVAFEDEDQDDKATVMRFNGLVWETVGPAGFTPGPVSRPSLAVADGTPYLVFEDDMEDDKATVMKFNGAAWETVGPVGFTGSTISGPFITVDNGTPYVVFRDDDNGDKATVMRYVSTGVSDAEAVANTKAALAVGYAGGDSASDVTQDVTLNTAGLHGTTVSWASDKAGVIASDGTVQRPPYAAGNQSVTLTATITKGSETDTRTFAVVVTAAQRTDAEAVAEAKAALAVGYAAGDSAVNVTQNVVLSAAGLNETAISWSSSDPAVVASDGTIHRPAFSAGDANVTLTATITKNNASDTQTYHVRVLKHDPQQNAELVSLVSSHDNFVFSPDTLQYTVNVGNTATSITVTPTLADPSATVKINDTLVTSGQPSQAIVLRVGQNVIPVTVTAQDGVTNKIYTLTVNRADSSSGGGGSWNTSSPSGDTRTVSVLTGGSKGTPAVSVEITRTTTGGSTKDLVTLTKSKAEEALAKADGNNKTLLIPMYDGKSSEADQVALTVVKEALAALASGQASIEMMAEKAKVTLPRETIAALDKQDLQITMERVAGKSEVQKTRTRLQAIEAGAIVVGTPLHIETNFAGKSKITLPLTGMKLPVDPKELDSFLRSLGVFIEHSDGESKLDKGQIEYDENKKPAGISIWVDKFSTFTIVGLPGDKMEENPAAASLTDIQGHWAQKRIEQLIQAGAIAGYPDKTFKPDQTITRAEFVEVVVKAFGLQPKADGQAEFRDTTAHWAKEAIDTAYAHGVISGHNAAVFGADERITREQMAVILTNVKKQNAGGKEVADFGDAASISEWAQEAVAKAAAMGMVTGYPDQTFQPQRAATRSEAVMMITNALQVK
ncbi:immunoglobulin-like domain-containing protein [Paenibacillus sp. FJAT-26967]|uniref:immunoglobulin-like domain-containing protein n=1 Tax=Paenibacillus sp. FJAT-26967 TaxID=1729690 RepID=UPI000838C848|nr:immunoglobulin-like domain-containing protein [Paenibacillus sp. FJAT-26967]